MPGLKQLGRTVIITSLLAFVGSGVAMALRVRGFYDDQPVKQFHFLKLSDRQTRFRGKAVTINDTMIDGTQPAIRVQYGDQTVTFAVHPPPIRDYPDLGGYTEWMQPVLFAPITRGQIDIDWETGEGVRMVVVNRRTAADFDQDTWGAVKVKEFQFDLFELTPDGAISQRTVQFPSKEYRTGRRYLPAKKLDPNAQVEMLEERTWEWQAALFALPAMQIGRYRYSNDAVAGMGWTLPVSGISAMGVMVGFGLIAASRIDARRGKTAAA